MKRLLALSVCCGLFLANIVEARSGKSNPNYKPPKLGSKYSDDKNWPEWGDEVIDFIKETLERAKAEAQGIQEVPKAVEADIAKEKTDQEWTDRFVLEALHAIAARQAELEAENNALEAVEATQDTREDEDPPPAPPKPK